MEPNEDEVMDFILDAHQANVDALNFFPHLQPGNQPAPAGAGLNHLQQPPGFLIGQQNQPAPAGAGLNHLQQPPGFLIGQQNQPAPAGAVPTEAQIYVAELVQRYNNGPGWKFNVYRRLTLGPYWQNFRNLPDDEFIPAITNFAENMVENGLNIHYPN